MQGHFSVINKRGLITACILIFFSILLFAFSLAKLVGGGSRLWIALLAFAACFCLISLLILRAVATAGVDVENGQVIFASTDSGGVRAPQFSLSALSAIALCGNDGPFANPETDCLLGARVVFTADNQQQFVYYPVAITYKQFANLRNGLFQLKSTL